MRRRFQFSLQWMFALTLLLAIAAALAHYERRERAERQIGGLLSRQKQVLEKYLAIENSGGDVRDQIRKERAKVRDLEQRLREQRGY